MKNCTKCSIGKDATSFYRHSNGRIQSWCKSCIAENRKRWTQENPGYMKGYRIKNKYGLSSDEWMTMLVLQDSRCAVCQEDFSGPASICVDHDHKTNIVRALLCNSCNIALGHFRDDVQIVESAVTYL